MVNETNSYKRELGVQWVKAESGTTYLCPLKELKQLSNPTEEQLRGICVDESQDPHNQ